MIVGEYNQRAVYKRDNVVGNGPDNILETFGVINLLISSYTMFFYEIFDCTYCGHCEQAR